MGRKIYPFTVGATAYNEAKNIGTFIKSVQTQNLPINYVLKEIVIIASGCTDDTIPTIEEFQKNDKRIKLITQKAREGKAIAVNIFLKKAKTKLCILQSPDTIPHKNCFKRLLEQLNKKGVGLTAGRVVPKDSRKSFLGKLNNIKWKLHHQINILYTTRPKVGELIAFKKVFERIPPETAVDEASIEPLIHLQGLLIKYVPDAHIYNQGPKTIREYLSQRRRIFAGHYVTKKKYSYEIITLSATKVLPIFINNIIKTPKDTPYALAAFMLEAVARLVGYIDVKLNLRDHTVWRVAPSSKKVIT
jgi:cellulose synthase/poly-beta-1,6-N-acetylglucosamine synthase-like glycosyltransferase